MGRRLSWLGYGVTVLAVLWMASVVIYTLGERSVAVLSRLLTVSRRVPIYRVEVRDNRLAISFDAMWGTSRTDRLLEVLRRHGVKTTFFLGGNWVDRYPDYVRKLVAEGHEIGNHTYTHPHLNSLSREQIRWELEENQRRIEALVGELPVRLFRPPFGEYSDKVIEVASELGYYTIQWSIDSLDWQNLSADAMVRRILPVIGPGDIVLFHNDGMHTPEAVDRLLPELKARGLSVVPISQLIYRSDYIIEPHSGVQKPGPRAPLAPTPVPH